MADRKVAIVTGAARPWGLGRATAVVLAQRGYDVAIVDIRDDWGVEGAESIAKQTGQRAIYVKTDVSKRAEVFAMVDRVVAEFGRVDVLVNDAATAFGVPFEEFTDEQFYRVIGINLLGPMLCTQAVVKPMKAQHYGRITSIASTAPFQPPPPKFGAVSLYNASKGGLIGFTKSAAVELAPYGIVVNVVAVGAMATAMGSETPPSPEQNAFMEKNVYLDALPWGRLIKPEETAETVADVVCSKSYALLGATIHASGGRVMPL